MNPPYSTIIEEFPTPCPSLPPAPFSSHPLESKFKIENKLEDCHSNDSLDTQKSVTATLNFTRSEIFHSAILDRKRKSFNNLKEWDTNRANFLNIHRSILENINVKMETEIKKSQHFMNILIRFLKERLHQEASIFHSAPKKIESVTEDQQYDDFSKKLEFFERIATDKCVKAQEFASLIDKKLLTEKLYPEKEKYDLQISALTDSINKTKKKLALLNADTSEKSAKYSTLFFTMINVPFGKKNEKDLYRREIAFLRTAYAQLETQKKLSRDITEGYKVWFELERNRKETLEIVLDCYGKKYKENYKMEKEEEKVEEEKMEVLNEEKEKLDAEASNVINQEEKKDFFECVLNEKDREIMKMNEDGFKKILEDFNFEKVTDFLINFEVIKIKERPLILKELKASRDQGGIIKNFNQCKLIITVDGFLLCLDSPFEEEEFKKPSMIINLENTATIKVKESGIIEFMRIKPGFLMNTLEKFIFKFDSKDDVDEMLEYINRYNIKEN